MHYSTKIKRLQDFSCQSRENYINILYFILSVKSATTSFVPSIWRCRCSSQFWTRWQLLTTGNLFCWQLILIFTWQIILLDHNMFASPKHVASHDHQFLWPAGHCLFNKFTPTPHIRWPFQLEKAPWRDEKKPTIMTFSTDENRARRMTGLTLYSRANPRRLSSPFLWFVTIYEVVTVNISATRRFDGEWRSALRQ